jgi:putative transposase
MAEIRQELLEELLADYEKPEDLVGPDGLLRDLFKRLIETAAGAELTEHLGYERGDPAGRGSGDNRNGTTSKTLVTEHGDVTVDMPRDRESSFEPRIVAKGQTHWHGFDDKIISMYAGGMTYAEIRGHLAEIYGVEVSKDFISTVTDQVLEDVEPGRTGRSMRVIRSCGSTRWWSTSASTGWSRTGPPTWRWG